MEKNKNGLKVLLLMLIIILIGIFGYLAYQKYTDSKEALDNCEVEETNLLADLDIKEQASLYNIIEKIKLVGLTDFNDGTDENIDDMIFANFTDNQMALYLLWTRNFRATDTICLSNDSESGALKNCILDSTYNLLSASGYNEAVSLDVLNSESGAIFGKEINVANLNDYMSIYNYNDDYYVVSSDINFIDPLTIYSVSLVKVGDNYVATIKARGCDDCDSDDITYKFTFSTLINSINAYTVVPISFIQED